MGIRGSKFVISMIYSYREGLSFKRKMGITGSKTESDTDDNDSPVDQDNEEEEEEINVQESDVTSSVSHCSVQTQTEDVDKNKDVKMKKVKVGKVEKNLVINGYRTYQGDFENIVWSIKRHSVLLSPGAMDLYESAEFETLKRRVTRIFVRTMDEGDSDDEIANDINFIKNMEAQLIHPAYTDTETGSHLNLHLPTKRQMDENDEDGGAGSSKCRRIEATDGDKNDNASYRGNGEENTDLRNIGFEYYYNDNYTAPSYCVNGDNNEGPYHNVDDN